MKINENMAEFMGILIGDGHLHFSKKSDKRKVYYVSISGSFSEDYNYHNEHIKSLFYKIFKTNITLIKQNRRNELLTKKHSKEIVSYIKNNFDIPTGNKSDNCKIPENILKSNKKIKSAFLRGLADTDFSLMFKKKNKFSHDYPLIKITFKSKNLIKDVRTILKEFEFKFGKIVKEVYFDKRFNKNYQKYNINLYGKNNLEKWMKLIGFKNIRQSTKYEIWKKFGFCPAKINLKERLELLHEE